MQVKIEGELTLKVTLPQKDVEAAIAAIKATGLDIEIGGDESDMARLLRVTHRTVRVEPVKDAAETDYYAHCLCGAVSHQFISRDNAETWTCPIAVAVFTASQNRGAYTNWMRGER